MSELGKDLGSFESNIFSIDWKQALSKYGLVLTTFSIIGVILYKKNKNKNNVVQKNNKIIKKSSNNRSKKEEAEEEEELEEDEQLDIIKKEIPY